MNLKKLILVLIILWISSCNLIKNGKSSASVDEREMLFPSKYSFTDKDEVAYFTSEDFVFKALSGYTIDRLNKDFRFLKCTKETIVNTHNHSVVDTIYTYSNPKNKIQIYRAVQHDLFISFDVTDSKFKLTGDIYPGMLKDAFYKKFLIEKPTNNKVQIGNSEGTIKFMFTFKNNRLASIESDFYLD